MITITIDTAAFSKFEQAIRALSSAQTTRALVDGLNEGGDKTRTQVRRALKEQTSAIRYGTITKGTDSVRAHAGNMAYTIKAKGSGLPITEFKTKVTKQGVQATVWGKARTFKRSFATSNDGKLRARTSAQRFPIRSLRGPSLPKELTKDLSLEAFNRSVVNDVQHAVDKRLARLAP